MCGDTAVQNGSFVVVMSGGNETIERNEACDPGLYCIDGITSCKDSSSCAPFFADTSCETRVVNGCTPICLANVCGDQYVGLNIDGVVEECDDGNDNVNDTCKNDCMNNVCGDGIPNR